MRGFYVMKNPFVKPSLSINEGFSTIEGSTIEGFQCTLFGMLLWILTYNLFGSLALEIGKRFDL